jgi:tripartite-type tricarboxylate transporter receptor subunit TctC
VHNIKKRARKRVKEHVKRRMAILITAAGALLICASPALAAFPDHPIRIIIGSAPSGGGDTVARIMAVPMGKALAASMILENRPGASGNIGANTVAKSAPDGYTLLLAYTGHAINPAIFANMPFDTARDFRAVAKIADNQSVFLVNPSVPAHSMKEFVSLVKKQPNHYSYAALFGTTQYMGGLVLASHEGMKMIFVPYKGNASAVNDLLGGHVNAMLNTIGSSLPFIKGGNARALAVAADRRSPLLPDVPTMAEAGIPGVNANGWYAFMAPAATPDDVIDVLTRAVKTSLDDPKVREALAGLGSEADYVPPKKFDAFVKDEIVHWQTVAKNAGVKAE